MLNQGTNAGYQAAANTMPTAPRTIASAGSRLDDLHQRLCKAREHLTALADQLGALRAVSGAPSKAEPPTIGAVGRLNDSADAAHYQVSEIEELLGSIERVLG